MLSKCADDVKYESAMCLATQSSDSDPLDFACGRNLVPHTARQVEKSKSPRFKVKLSFHLTRRCLSEC